MSHPVSSMKSRLRSFVSCVADESIWVVLVGLAFCIFAGALMMMLLSSCNGDDKKKEARQMAVESLRLVTGNPKSLRIIAFSEMDSVFGNCYFSNEEMQQILDNTLKFSESMFGEGAGNVNFSDPRMEAKFIRVSSLSDIVRVMMSGMSEQSDPMEFSGWRLKALYQYTDNFNDTVRNERYFIFDKDQKYILNSFDIPIL